MKKNMHAGAISKINMFSDGTSNLILSGGLRDGVLNILDMRTLQKVQSGQVHTGSINWIATTLQGHVVTGSADKSVKMWDPRNGLSKPLKAMKTTDAVFCGEMLKDRVALVGTGDGNLLAFDLQAPGNDCMYGYGCDEVGAVHCMQVCPDLKGLCTGGDSGQALKIIFSGF